MSCRFLVVAALLFGLIPTHASVVFPADTQWKYSSGLTEASPGDLTAWRLPDFDDSSWATGLAPFYYDDQPGSATAYSGTTDLTDMRGNYTCIFMRKTFQ